MVIVVERVKHDIKIGKIIDIVAENSVAKKNVAIKKKEGEIQQMKAKME